MTISEISKTRLAALASAAGLALAGVTTAEPFRAEEQYIAEHVTRGHMRGMDWFTVERARQSADPTTLHDRVSSIVSLGLPFWSGSAEPPDDGILRGRIARYAWGRDYHRVLKRRMKVFVASLEGELNRRVESRNLVDTARAFDRAVAARSGVGWYGKNSMIIVPHHGSWVMLGEMYLDVHILPDLPLNQDCGRCNICIAQCPTGAIIEPYRIDAPRCISYLTIEERGDLPRDLRHLMGNWVFGCDVCQDVCPYTKAAQEIDDADFQPASIDNAFPSLKLLATMDREQYLATFSGTAVTRAKRRGLARNAAVALGNSSAAAAEPILADMTLNHDEALARSHAVWGLWHLTGSESHRALRTARSNESDPQVRSEIDQALANYPEDWSPRNARS